MTNETGNVYSPKYPEIPKLFFMLHHRQRISKATKKIVNATMVSKPTGVFCVIISIIRSEIIAVIMCSNNDHN
jgi:hypothetical protein